MHPVSRLVAGPRLLTLAVFLTAAIPASGQDSRNDPVGPGEAPAPAPTASAAVGSLGVTANGWSGYRPGTAWTPSHPASALPGSPVLRAQAAPMRSRRAYVTQSGWATYAPSSAWTGYRGQTAAPTTVGRVPVYASRTGWATYAPSTAWVGYQPIAGWQSYEPGAGRPLNMRQARVPGPSPYADGLARNYIEYGTGRMVPLAKPWLPGSP